MRNVVIGVVVAGVLAVGGLLVAISMQPDVLHVERSVVVPTPAEDVWPLVSDMKGFISWSPWQELDPDQTVAFSEVTTGPGAWYTWKGDENVGSGRMEITSVTPMSRVEQDLAFIEPFASNAKVALALAPEGAGTKVTWSMASPNDFMGKAMCLVMDMDAMLGADFEKGLGKLSEKAVAGKAEREAAAKAAAEVQAELDQAALEAGVPPTP